MLGLSVEAAGRQGDWAIDTEQTQGIALKFPLIADAVRSVSEACGMIHPKSDGTLTVRCVFVIGRDATIMLMLTYPASTGRNFIELLRTIDSLRLTAEYKIATPANWLHGEDCIIVPAVLDTEADRLFPKGYRTAKPYLRTTPRPNP